MAVTGHYLAWQIRSLVEYVRAFGECVLHDVMPAFGNLEKRAEEVANSEYERLGSEPVGEYGDDDMASAAEAAHEKGLAFYETLVALRQTTLNLFTAGLFHLLEQELADFCYDGAFTVRPPADSNLKVVAEWYRRHFDLDLQSLPSWPSIDELRLVANTVKHAEGGSARQLRERHPELFEHPLVRHLLPGESGALRSLRPIRLPLGGEDLYVTEDLFQEYSQAANQLMADISKHFEVHGAEYYPRGW